MHHGCGRQTRAAVTGKIGTSVLPARWSPITLPQCLEKGILNQRDCTPQGDHRTLGGSQRLACAQKKLCRPSCGKRYQWTQFFCSTHCHDNTAVDFPYIVWGCQTLLSNTGKDPHIILNIMNAFINKRHGVLNYSYLMYINLWSCWEGSCNISTKTECCSRVVLQDFLL